MARRTAEKIARTGIERVDGMMYFIKQGDVWGVPRRRPGERSEPARLIAAAGVEMDFANYLYYVDADGDIARMPRHVKPKPKKKKKKVAKKKPKKVAKKKKKKKKAQKKRTPPREAARVGFDERTRDSRR